MLEEFISGLHNEISSRAAKLPSREEVEQETSRFFPSLVGALKKTPQKKDILDSGAPPGQFYVTIMQMVAHSDLIRFDLSAEEVSFRAVIGSEDGKHL